MDKNKNINMTDILRQMLDSGKDIEAIMKDVTDAANALQKERDKDNSVKNLVHHYTSPLDIEGSTFTQGICTRKMTPRDFAIVKAHFLAQNIPGFIECQLDSGTGNGDINTMLDIIEKSTEAQVRMYKGMIDVANRPDNEKLDGMLTMLFDEVNKMLSDGFEEKKHQQSCSHSNDLRDPIVKFFGDNGLI